MRKSKWFFPFSPGYYLGIAWSFAINAKKGALDMKRLLFVAILGTILTTGLCAETPPPAPGYTPVPLGPSLPSSASAAMARLNKKGQVVFNIWTTRAVPVTATRILRDGKEVKEKHTFYEEVSGWEDQAIDPKDIKLLGSDGKPLDKKMLPELLKKERPVLYMYGDDKIDSTFLKVIKEGTPIFLLPIPAGVPS
jgi:hypothetical protein